MRIIETNLVDIENRTIYPVEIKFDKKIKSITKIDKKVDNYILAGFIDAHIHIESSMLPPTSFALLAKKFGTIATVSDPHEIANVLGLDGVLWMIENGKKSPLKIYFGASPCVPATPFETSGATLTLKDIETLFKRDDILYLSEVMNFIGVINNDDDMLAKIKLAKKYNKHIDGHSPALRGEGIDKYVKAGVETDHEAFTYEEGLEKLQKGMKIQIREGSAAKNFDALHKLIPDYSDNLMFCSDDKHPDDLEKGHINELVKRSLKLGYDLFDVLKIACINPVKHYGLDIGLLKVGDNSDFIMVKDLEEFEVVESFINGENILETDNFVEVEVVNNFNTTLKNIEDFSIKNCNKYKVIEVIDGELVTNKIEFEGKVPTIKDDILLLSVTNRYLNEKPAISLIKGFGLKEGAIASSVAHDSHNIVAVGVDEESLNKAVNEVIKLKGGIVAVNGDEVKSLQLDIAGIMSSDEPIKVAKKYEEIQNYAQNLGSNLKAPFMSLSFMALLVIPELKLSDKGLFDGTKFEFCNICS